MILMIYLMILLPQPSLRIDNHKDKGKYQHKEELMTLILEQVTTEEQDKKWMNGIKRLINSIKDEILLLFNQLLEVWNKKTIKSNDI